MPVRIFDGRKYEEPIIISAFYGIFYDIVPAIKRERHIQNNLGDIGLQLPGFRNSFENFWVIIKILDKGGNLIHGMI